MEEHQHAEDAKGPARGFISLTESKRDQPVHGRLPNKGHLGPPERSIFDSPHNLGTGTSTASVCIQQLLGSSPIHINLRGPGLSRSDVPSITEDATSFSAFKKQRKGEDERCNTLNLLSTWTTEGEQVFHYRPSVSCAADCVQAITRPLDYVMSLQGKNVRSQLLSAFNVWLQVDGKSYNVIDKVIGMLHDASLL